MSKDPEPFKTRADLEAYFSGDRIECLICHRTFKALGKHIQLAHPETTIDDYKDRFGIPRTWGLVSDDLSRQISKAAVKRMAEMDPEKRAAITEAGKGYLAEARRSGANLKPSVEAVSEGRRRNGVKRFLKATATQVTVPCKRCGVVEVTGPKSSAAKGLVCPDCKAIQRREWDGRRDPDKLKAKSLRQRRRRQDRIAGGEVTTTAAAQVLAIVRDQLKGGAEIVSSETIRAAMKRVAPDLSPKTVKARISDLVAGGHLHLAGVGLYTLDAEIARREAAKPRGRVARAIVAAVEAGAETTDAVWLRVRAAKVPSTRATLQATIPRLAKAGYIKRLAPGRYGPAEPPGPRVAPSAPPTHCEITETSVLGLPITDREYIVWDAQLAGFGVRVKPSGAKSYMAQARSAAGPSRRITFGQVGEIKAGDARKAARLWKDGLRNADVPEGLDHADA